MSETIPVDRRCRIRPEEVPQFEPLTESPAPAHALGLLEATQAKPAPWRVAQSLVTLRDQVNEQFPKRSKASDGTIGDAEHATRDSDHNPWVKDGNMGVVTAMDITHDPANGCDAGKLAEAIRGSKDKRVKYIIWNRRIANASSISGKPAWAWRPYKGKNPHDHHVHISVQDTKSRYDSTAAWTIA